MAFFYLLLLLLLPLSITILAITIISRSLAAAQSPTQPPLPPGPKPWPVVGNLPHLGKKLHTSLQTLSNLYGPLISLRLGSQLLVVASSPAAATEILKTHDRLLSARFVPRVVPYDMPELDGKAVIWASSCNDQWKAFRAMFRNQIFSAKAIESQAAVREKKVARMVEFLDGKLGETVGIAEVVFVTVFDSLSNLIFSRDSLGFGTLMAGQSTAAHRLKSHLFKMLELAASPNLADFFPILARLDPQGLRRESFRHAKEFCSVWKPYVKERRQKRRERERFEAGDFLDVFLENGLTDDQIDWLTLELFVAGTDTNMLTIEWAMAELIKNEGAMNKLRDELNRELLSATTTMTTTTVPIGESEVYKLPYLNAIVKETLRLHPPAPLLAPHRAAESCVVMNYTIPKGAEVMVNVWAISHDPKVWGHDWASFRPERFIGSTNVDFRGQDFELLPFGAGRRMCPGVPLAARQIPLILAALVRNFDWRLPDGGDPSELDMNDKFGLSVEKEQPLLLVPSQSS